MQNVVAQSIRQRIVVLGGAGFIGSSLVRRLVHQRHAVYVVDNFFHGSPQNLADIPEVEPVTELDALDYSSLRSYMTRVAPDIVVNCIGDTFIPSAYDMPERFLDLNVRTTLNVLRASADAKVKRVLHLSSTEVYGDNAATACTELAVLAPENTYAVSKMAADRLCYTFALEHGLPTVIARLFNAYGPRETHPYIVPEIIAQLSVSNNVSLGNLDAERGLDPPSGPKRVAMLHPAFDRPGGAEDNVVVFSEALIERGWSVKIVTARWNPGAFDGRLDRFKPCLIPRPRAGLAGAG